MSKTILCLFALLGLSNITGSGQNTREVLTNAQIIEMVQKGWGESLIVAKLNKSECKCDISAAAISKLKAAKVTDAVIMAMIDASPGGYRESRPASRQDNQTQKPTEQLSDTASPTDRAIRAIGEPGIYLYENGQFSVMEPSVFSGTKTNIFGSVMTGGIAKSKMRATIPRKASNTQVEGRQPVFYFIFSPEVKTSSAVMSGSIWGLPATSPAEFLMVQMQVKKGTREAVVGEMGLFSGISTGARDKDIREYTFEKVKPGVYKVVTKNLSPGEYAFYYAGTVSGLISGGKIFDFGVK